jgi:lysophospholipase L1-like esterase
VAAPSTETVASRLAWPAKLLLGFAVAAALLLGGELVAHALLGEPPPFDQVTRTSFCRVQVEGERWRYHCEMEREAAWRELAHDGRPRVVFLGASSMHEPVGASVPARVAELLPGVEVLNLSAPGLSVANLAVVAAQLEPLRPDLAVVYAGHNEYSQDVFHGRVQATRLALLPVYGVMARSWIHAGLTRLPRGERRLRRWGIATEDPTALELAGAIEQRFEADLGLLIRQAPCPVLLSTLMRNSDAPPSGVLAAPDSPCGVALGDLAQMPARTALLEQARRSCGESSITAWLQTHAELEAGRPAAAREAFARSLALDPVPLRAPLVADDIIRRLAAERGVELVDLERELGLFPGLEWFVDPIHFSHQGASVVAEVFAPRIEGALGLPPR